MTEYRNPQNEPGAEKRLLVSFVVLFVALLLMQQMFRSQKPAEQAQKNAAQQTQQPSQAPASMQQAAANAPAAPVATVQASSEAETVVENSVYRITFTNRGGLVKSWQLKQHKDEAGKPLELVHAASAQYGSPLSFWSWDTALTTQLNSALYVASTDGSGPLPRSLTFQFSEGGLVVKKTFSFDDTYVVKIDTSVQRNGHYETALVAWPSGLGDMTQAASYVNQHIDYFTGSKLERLKADRKGKDIGTGHVLNGPFEWAASSDQYFAAVFMPVTPQSATLVQLRNGLQVPKDPAKPTADKVDVDLLGTAVGSIGGPVSQRLYVGPKSVDVLASVKTASGNSIEAVQDFGFWSLIAKPLFAWARWTEKKFIPNWGWTIIVLTVIINLVLMPLRWKSMRSALEMQKVAPHIKQIQEKYKQFKLNDPRRAEMTQEINAIYAEHKINPAAGCLPLLIQMPFLFAFYGMLANAFEMRQANFYWLNDLSQPDKYFVLPVLIVASMFLMQRMTPNTGMSAEQQRMMNFMMPIIFGSMSYAYPSGLALYWVTGTIVGIGQQYIMNHSALGKEMRAIAEKRVRKQQGKGKN